MLQLHYTSLEFSKHTQSKEIIQ